MADKKQCISCKFFEQGKTCSFCSNPAQTNKDYQVYLYHNFSCELHKDGIAQSRLDYMKNGITNG